MVSIKRILCPVDFSEFSLRALDRAVAIARSHGASIRALHVAWDPLLEGLMPYVGREGLEPLNWPKVDREGLLVQLKEFVSGASTGVPVEYSVVEAPKVHEEIVAQADRISSDLIVLGTHGRSGFQRLVLGSVAEKVLRTARQPVLTVPCGAPEALPLGGPAFTRILCATDFSECSRAALHYASSLADSPGAQLTVLHVVELGEFLYDPLNTPPLDVRLNRPAYEAVGRARLEQVIRETLPDRELEQIVSTGRAYQEVLRVANELKSDLIVLGIHGRNPIDRLMFGSTAEPIVRRATCPVLTVRPHIDAARAAA